MNVACFPAIAVWVHSAVCAKGECLRILPEKLSVRLSRVFVSILHNDEYPSEGSDGYSQPLYWGLSRSSVVMRDVRPLPGGSVSLGVAGQPRSVLHIHVIIRAAVFLRDGPEQFNSRELLPEAEGEC